MRPLGFILLMLLASPMLCGRLPQLPRLTDSAEKKPAVTQIKIIGLQSFSEESILTELGGRLDHITQNRTARWRAADAAFLVEQYLQLAGFNDALVKWKILGPNQIRLRVSEGSRDILGTVAVGGIPDHELNSTLTDLFELNPKKRASGLDEYPVSDEDVDAGIALMQQQMQSLGFYDSKIELKSREPDPETGRINFYLHVTPGRVSKIASPTFEGATIDGLKQTTSVFIGLTATATSLNLMRSRVVDLYSEKGFIQAKIRMTAEISPGQIRPHFEITRGKRFRLGNLELKGLEKTDPNRILNLLEPLKGEVINGPLAQRRIGEIIATGAFSSVRTEFDTSQGDVVDATLHFEEGKARGVSFTAGYDTFEGAIFGSSYYNRNFRGKLRNFSAGFEISQLSLLGEVALTNPWLFGSDYRSTSRLFALSKDYEGFDNLRGGVEWRISRKFNDHYSAEFSAMLAYVTNSPDGLLPRNLGEEEYVNTAFRLNQLLDYRDNPTMPTTGWHVAVPFELGSAVGDDASNYVKFGVEGSYHHNISKRSQFAVGARGGLIVTDGGTDTLPIDLRYFLGGARSVRSFPDRELGPRSITGYWTGGEAYWVVNAEYTRALAGPLRGVVFVDAGGLSRNWEDFGFGSPELAVGLGLRINLPIGPARLEYGHNLTRDISEPSGTWHFAIGTTF